MIGRMAWRDRPLVDLAYGALAVGSLVFVVYGARHMTFFGDEWDFITMWRELSLDALMQPHNEHWSLFLVVLYRALFGAFGLSSYLPYLGLLAMLHVAAATGVYAVLRKATTLAAALAGGALMLFLGSGYENLVWAFQMGFIGAAAAGIWALYILMRARTAGHHLLAGMLLLVAVATQGVGVFFLASCLVFLVARGTRMGLVAIAIGPPAGIYLAWYAAYGRTMVAEHRNPFTLDALQQVPSYVLSGGGGAVGSLTGLGPEVGSVVFVLGVGAAVWSVLRGLRVPPLVLAAIVGIVVELGLIGLVRAQFGLEQARSSRYLYISAMFLLLMFGGWLGRRPVARWRRGLALATLGALTAFAVTMNVEAYFDGRRFFEGMAQETRAIARMVETDAPWLDPAQETFGRGIPGEAALRELMAEHGTPSTDAILPRIAAPPPPEAVDRAIIRTAGSLFRVESVSDVPLSRLTLEPAGVQNLSTRAHGSCLRLRETGPDAAVLVRASGEHGLSFASEDSGEARIYLTLNAAPQDSASIAFSVFAGGQYLIRLPPAPADRPWLVRFDPPPGTRAGTLCWAG